MLIVKQRNAYRKGANTVVTYEVSSDASDKKVADAEIAAYKDVQTKTLGKDSKPVYREDGGTPLFFSQDVVPNGTELFLTQKTKRYTLKTDLTGRVERVKANAELWEGKLTALANFAGMSKAQVAQQMLAM